MEYEIKILSKVADAVEQVARPKVRYRLVAAPIADGAHIRRACNDLGVPRSGFVLGRPTIQNRGELGMRG